MFGKDAHASASDSAHKRCCRTVQSNILRGSDYYEGSVVGRFILTGAVPVSGRLLPIYEILHNYFLYICLRACACCSKNFLL
jgi:hypothetical protein